LYRRCEAAG